MFEIKDDEWSLRGVLFKKFFNVGSHHHANPACVVIFTNQGCCILIHSRPIKYFKKTKFILQELFLEKAIYFTNITEYYR